MTSRKERAHLFITGRVQGVFFRLETRDQAKKRNVTGWIRNRSDGRVETVFEGDIENVEKMIEFCKIGPPSARVATTDVQWEDYSGQFKDFRILRTPIL
jgi:acylphosphatase